MKWFENSNGKQMAFNGDDAYIIAQDKRNDLFSAYKVIKQSQSMFTHKLSIPAQTTEEGIKKALEDFVNGDGK